MEKRIVKGVIFSDIISTLMLDGHINQWNGAGIGKIQKEVFNAVERYEGVCDFDDYTGEYGMFRLLLIADGLAFAVSQNSDNVVVYEFTHRVNLTEENYKTIYEESGAANCGVTYEQWRNFEKFYSSKENCSDFVTDGEIWNWGGVIHRITTININNSVERYEKEPF